MADKELTSIMEAFYNAAPYGPISPSEQESETVSYSKTKKKGDASVTVSANADSMDELHQILKLAGIDFDNKGEMDHDHEEESPCDQDDEAEGGEEGPVVVSLKPQSSQGYNSIGGDKKEILNALMNRYKSL